MRLGPDLFLPPKPPATPKERAKVPLQSPVKPPIKKQGVRVRKPTNQLAKRKKARSRTEKTNTGDERQVEVVSRHGRIIKKTSRALQ